VLVGPAVITTDDVLEAAASVNTLNANWETYVAITLSPEGAERFRVATRECVDRRIAIIVNDQVESAPIVKSEIGGGRMSITMGAAGSPEEQLAQAKALANSLGGRRANAP
jgi:preprotein translocase subunit SecD